MGCHFWDWVTNRCWLPYCLFSLAFWPAGSAEAPCHVGSCSTERPTWQGPAAGLWPTTWHWDLGAAGHGELNECCQQSGEWAWMQILPDLSLQMGPQLLQIPWLQFCLEPNIPDPQKLWDSKCFKVLSFWGAVCYTAIDNQSSSPLFSVISSLAWGLWHSPTWSKHSRNADSGQAPASSWSSILLDYWNRNSSKLGSPQGPQFENYHSPASILQECLAVSQVESRILPVACQALVVAPTHPLSSLSMFSLPLIF